MSETQKSVHPTMMKAILCTFGISGRNSSALIPNITWAQRIHIATIWVPLADQSHGYVQANRLSAGRTCCLLLGSRRWFAPGDISHWYSFSRPTLRYPGGLLHRLFPARTWTWFSPHQVCDIHWFDLVVTLILTENRRPTLWLLSFQVCALGCTGFVWALAYTTSSPTTLDARSLSVLRSASLVSPLMTLFVLPALCFGYVLPAVLMALPSRKIVTNNFQQMALVSWNLFPLLVFGILKFLGILVPVFSRWRSDRPASSPQEHIRFVRLVSFASLVVSTAIHIAVITVSISSVLFPALFDAEYLGDLSPASIFPPPVSIRRGDTVGDGVRSFFLWDQASGYPIMMIVKML